MPPIYEYKCSTCESKTTLLRRVDERDDEVKCNAADCSGLAEKVISITSFHLKGGGWADSGYADVRSVDGYDGCNTHRKKIQRAAEIGDEKP